MTQLGYERSFFMHSNRNRWVSFTSNLLIVFLTLLGASAQGELVKPGDPGPYAVSAASTSLSTTPAAAFFALTVVWTPTFFTRESISRPF
jgi:hypothetical protein